MKPGSTQSTDGIAVIITAGNSPNAYDLVRCLGRAGIACCVMSSDKRDIAFSSRFCQVKVILPQFGPKKYHAILEMLMVYGATQHDKPVLFYPSDPELRFVWKFRKELEQHYRFLMPPGDILEPLFNKVEFIEFARRNSIPVPGGIICRNPAELETRLNQVSFPCIVKPAFSDHWVWETEEQWATFGPYKNALRRFERADELVDFCRALPERSAGFVVQEYIDGRDEGIHSFHGYFDEQSKCQAYFLGCKIRTYPMHTGGSAYIRTVYHPNLADMSIRMLEKFNYRGIVKIDFKYDKDRGDFKVLEINTRYNLWQLLGAFAGVNLAAVAFRHQRGESWVGEKRYIVDFRLLSFKQDLRAFLTGYIHSGEWNILSYLRSLVGKKCYRMWDPRDVVPFFMSVSGFLRRNFLRLLRLEWSAPPEKSSDNINPSPVGCPKWRTD